MQYRFAAKGNSHLVSCAVLSRTAISPSSPVLSIAPRAPMTIRRDVERTRRSRYRIFPPLPLLLLPLLLLLLTSLIVAFQMVKEVLQLRLERKIVRDKVDLFVVDKREL